MHTLNPVIPLIALLASLAAAGQPAMDYPSVEARSIALYMKGDWKGLLTHGRQALAAGIDHLNLRLRMGYAAFATGDYATAIAQYEKALGFDSHDQTARYYIHLARRYLGQPEIATAEADRLPAALFEDEGLRKPRLTLLGAEGSYKASLVDIREDPFYGRLTLGYRLSPRLHLQHALSSYTQRIAEPLLTTLPGNTAIGIAQTGLWNRAALNLDRRWQALSAYHYQQNRFGGLVYHNHLLLVGARYHGSRLTVQGDAVVGRMIDTALLQANLTLQAYPLGNQNLYSITTWTLRDPPDAPVILRQVLGVKVLKDVWLEGHATIGQFRNFVEGDALYLYNSLDTDRVKAGIGAYIALPGGRMLQLGYTFEDRRLYGRKTTFYQHSFTGGITWRH
jgi:tetratricopeptide (TPR) repeat protein